MTSSHATHILLHVCLILLSPSTRCVSGAEDSRSFCSSSNGADIICTWVHHDVINASNTSLLVTKVTGVQYTTMSIINPLRRLDFTERGCYTNAAGNATTCSLEVTRVPNACGVTVQISLSRLDHQVDIDFDNEQIVTNPPSDITAEPGKSGQLVVTWSPPANQDEHCSGSSYFCVELNYASSLTPDQWIKVPFGSKLGGHCGVDPPKVIAQLAAATLYHVRMRTVVLWGGDRWGAWSQTVRGRTREEVPIGHVGRVKVSNLHSFEGNPSQRDIRLQWSELDEGTTFGVILGYVIHLLSPQQNWTSTSTSTTIQGLNVSQEYNGWIAGFNSAGLGQTSKFTIAELLVDPPLPVVEYSVSSTAIDVIIHSRDDISDFIDGYHIEWQEFGTNNRHNIDVESAREGAPSGAILTPLEPDTVYRVRVGAFRDARTVWTEFQHLETHQLKPSWKPRGFSAVPDQDRPTSVALHWSRAKANFSPRVLGYLVSYCALTTGPSDSNLTCHGPVHKINISESSRSPFRIDGLIPFTTYCFQIRAFNSVGQGPLSDCLVATTSEDRPSPPVSLQVATTTSSILHLNWSVPVSPNGVITHYQLTYNQATLHTNQTSARLPVHGNTEYNIEVVACNRAVPQLSCSVPFKLTVCTPIGAPPPPTIVKTSLIASNVVNLQWSAPLHPNGPLSHYIITVWPYPPDPRRPAEPLVTLNTTSMDAKVKVNCSSDVEQRVEAAVGAVNVDGDEEWVGDSTRTRMVICASPLGVSEVWIALMASGTALILSSVFAALIYLRCFKESHKFTIHFSDVVSKSKKNGQFQHFQKRPKQQEKEQFDSIVAKPPTYLEVEYVPIPASERIPDKMHVLPPLHTTKMFYVDARLWNGTLFEGDAAYIPAQPHTQGGREVRGSESLQSSPKKMTTTADSRGCVPPPPQRGQIPGGLGGVGTDNATERLSLMTATVADRKMRAAAAEKCPALLPGLEGKDTVYTKMDDMERLSMVQCSREFVNGHDRDLAGTDGEVGAYVLQAQA